MPTKSMRPARSCAVARCRARRGSRRTAPARRRRGTRGSRGSRRSSAALDVDRRGGVFGLDRHESGRRRPTCRPCRRRRRRPCRAPSRASYMRACASIIALSDALRGVGHAEQRRRAGSSALALGGTVAGERRSANGSFSVAHRSTSPPNSSAQKPAYLAISRTVRSRSTQPRSACSWRGPRGSATPSWIQSGRV